MNSFAWLWNVIQKKIRSKPVSIPTSTDRGGTSVRAFRGEYLKLPPRPEYEQLRERRSAFSALELEIGAGVGWHAIQNAAAQPEVLVVAVERTRDKFESFRRRLGRNERSNLIAVHADVTPWLWSLDRDIKFRKIWILYPNPEQGNRNQRWIHQPFFRVILDHLEEGGEIEMATNVPAYADEVSSYAGPNWGLCCVRETYSGPARTHFEKKYLERGETCYRLWLRRKS